MLFLIKTRPIIWEHNFAKALFFISAGDPKSQLIRKSIPPLENIWFGVKSQGGHEISEQFPGIISFYLPANNLRT